MVAYIALFSALLSRLTALACGATWVTSFIARFLNSHRSGVLTALAWLVPHETAAVLAQVLCTPYSHAPCHFMQSHICKVYVCLAVTCHLHFWQNDRDLLRATAVTRGWNGHQNKSQHRKSTLEKKILPPLQQGFEPTTFQSRVRHSNHWAIPAPVICPVHCMQGWRSVTKEGKKQRDYVSCSLQAVVRKEGKKQRLYILFFACSVGDLWDWEGKKQKRLCVLFTACCVGALWGKVRNIGIMCPGHCIQWWSSVREGKKHRDYVSWSLHTVMELCEGR